MPIALAFRLSLVDHRSGEATHAGNPAWDDPEMLPNVVVAAAWHLRDNVAPLLDPEVPVWNGHPTKRQARGCMRMHAGAGRVTFSVLPAVGVYSLDVVHGVETVGKGGGPDPRRSERHEVDRDVRPLGRHLVREDRGQ